MGINDVCGEFDILKRRNNEENFVDISWSVNGGDARYGGYPTGYLR